MPALQNIIAIGALCLSAAVAIADDNWPQWRGPNGNGVAPAGNYPVQFSPEKGVAWKVVLPGLGSSTPAVWGDAVFVTCDIDGQDGVCRYGFDGALIWKKELGPGVPGQHKNGSGANPSPVTDGKRVVVYYKSGLLASLDLAGEVIWQHNLQEEFGEDTLWWDLGTSPVLGNSKVIVAVMQDGTSYLVAYDLDTGELAWRQTRQYERPKESDQAYTTPTVVEVDGQLQLVVWGADHLTGHDLETGKQLWQCGGFNPEDKGMWRVIASQAVGDGIAVVPYGRGDFFAGVRLGGKGDVTATHRVWEKRKVGADVPTPIVYDGAILLLTDRGKINKLDLSTGTEIWSYELPRSKDKFYASPVLAGDMVYCTREDGVIFVGKTGEQFELLAENDLGEKLIATPIPIRGGLLVRGAEHLYRFE